MIYKLLDNDMGTSVILNYQVKRTTKVETLSFVQAPLLSLLDYFIDNVKELFTYS